MDLSFVLENLQLIDLEKGIDTPYSVDLTTKYMIKNMFNDIFLYDSRSLCC